MSVMAGKVAVVTGTSSRGGIGAAIVRRFAQSGATLFLAAEGPEDGLNAVADECRDILANRSRVAAEIVDLSLPGEAERMIERAAATFGRVDVLVNNAGVRARLRFNELTRKDFDNAVAVNLAAPLFASQAAARLMKAQGGGRIIHIASQMGTVAAEKRALYGTTKAALIYLAKAMAYELAPDGILVNAVSPGPVLTEYIDEAMKANPEMQGRLAYLRSGRMGTPEEIAEVVLFLATSAPEFLLGHNVIVDGGYTIH